MDFDSLRSFVVFSELLNFTRAADVLHLSQPALHVKVRKLADDIGMPLYEKSGRQLRLTPAGVATARFGREVEQHAATFRKEVHGEPSREAVVLAAGDGTFLYLLEGAIRRFARSSGRLRAVTRDWNGTIDDVRAGRAHLGVAPLATRIEGLTQRLLARVPQVVVAPVGHPLVRGRAVALRDLEGARMIVPPADRPHRVLLGRVLQTAGVRWEPVVEATGWPLTLRFVALGLGIAVVNGFCALPRGVRSRPIEGLPDVHYHLLQRAGAERHPEVARLSELLFDACAKWRR
jgi:DNA-binding transcriptional LysR family regulator